MGQIALLHQRLNTKADAAAIEELREQMLILKASMHDIEVRPICSIVMNALPYMTCTRCVSTMLSLPLFVAATIKDVYPVNACDMHPLQDDCQKQSSLVMEELELIRTAPLLPLPAAAPSSLILDIMSASESPAESQFPALHQEGSANAPYIPPGAAAEAASMATMQLNLHAGQKLAEESQTTKRPPSPGQVLKTQPTNADQLTRELAPEMAGSVLSHAGSIKASSGI